MFIQSIPHHISNKHGLFCIVKSSAIANLTKNKHLYRPCIYLHHSLIMNISWGMQTYATNNKKKIFLAIIIMKKRRKKTKDELPNHNTNYNRPQITTYILLTTLIRSYTKRRTTIKKNYFLEVFIRIQMGHEWIFWHHRTYTRGQHMAYKPK